MEAMVIFKAFTFYLGDWLIGSDQDGGAHSKYEPGDLRFDECRRRIYEHQNSTGVNKKKTKLDLFLEVCANLKPVFRYFFMENFKTSSIWYEKRLNYTRSVATASIVGKYTFNKSRK